MFEKLVGKVLSRLLSKYFVSEESSGGSPGGKRTSSSSWTQLGVWSGFVSLENLELRKDVINDQLRSKGLPLELVHCTLGRVEITVPWAKLGSKSKSKSSSPPRRFSSTDPRLLDNHAVVVVVVDGIHALFRTHYEFDDEAIRQAAITERRQELLQDSLSNREGKSSSTFSGLAGFFHKRIAEGILNDVLENLQVHIRDVHIRLEDVESVASSPFAFGVTLESLHVQADDDIAARKAESKHEGIVVSEGMEEECIRKMAQLNHFSMYWNALDYGDGLPAEFSVLHKMKESQPANLSQYLDRCIVRRSNSTSPSSNTVSLQSTPNHSYLLRPVDGICNVSLSTNPRNLELRPAIVASVHIEDVSLQLRDYQCNQIMGLQSSFKEHQFAMQYRRYRPAVPATEDPRAWWAYAFRVIRMELRESNMRWSWTRFHDRFELRRRYCELYERKMQYPNTRPIGRVSSRASLATEVTDSVVSTQVSGDIPTNIMAENLEYWQAQHVSTPDDGAGPSAVDLATPINTAIEVDPEGPRSSLSVEDEVELQELEDGIRGDLSVLDILIFRTLVNARVAGITAGNGPGGSSNTTSRFRRMMSSIVGDDARSEEEYARLVSYLESASLEKDVVADGDKEALIAVSIRTHLERGCVSFFSPLPSTTDLNQHRRLHERFLDFRISGLDLGYCLFGNYKSFRLQASLGDFEGSEIRSNMKEHIIVSRLHSHENDPLIGYELVGFPGSEGHELSNSPSPHSQVGRSPLISVELVGKPIESPGCDYGLIGHFEAVEILLHPECEWLRRLRNLAVSSPGSTSLSKNVASFWEDLSMARINSSDSAVAEFHAKADTALFKHTNIDIDVHMDCPVLRIGDGRGCDIVIDFGHALFSTERLAGVAMGELRHSAVNSLNPASDDVSEIGDRSVDAGRYSHPDVARRLSESDSQVMMPGLGDNSSYLSELATPMRGLNNFFRGSSAMSIDSGQYTGRSTMSLSHDDTKRLSSLMERDESQDYRSSKKKLSRSCFYDVFQLRLFSGEVLISGEGDKKPMDVIDKLSIMITFEKSVIPADHTLCRLKTHCVVDDISLTLSESRLGHMGNLVKAWKSVIGGGASHATPTGMYGSQFEGKMTIRSELLSRNAPRQAVLEDADDVASDASSVLDENEFLDALDDEDEDQNVSTWFDEPWTPDTGSDGEDVTTPSFRPNKQPSMSDISSVSDWSRRMSRRKRKDLNYLNEENLARLDEMIVEDNSENEGGSDSDAESFHSAMSIKDHNDLARALQEDIIQAESALSALKDEVVEAKEASGAIVDMEGARVQNQRKQAIRMEQIRLQAELRALRAAHHDLVSQIDAVDEVHFPVEEREQPTPPSPESPFSVATDNQVSDAATSHAKALLRARRRRSMPLHDAGGYEHNLTKGLNRELLRASLAVSKIEVDLVYNEADETDDASGDSMLFQLSVSHLSAWILQRANDIKAFTSIGNASAINKIRNDSALPANPLLVGGAHALFADSLLTSKYPNHIAKTRDESFLQASIDRRRQMSDNGKPFCDTAKLRVLFGDMELAPDPQVLQSLVLFGNKAKQLVHFARPNPAISPQRNTLDPKPFVVDNICNELSGVSWRNEKRCSGSRTRSFVDLFLRFSSFRLKLLDGDRITGAFVISDASARFGRALSTAVYRCRSQLDVKCGNAQMLQISEENLGSARELLGMRDSYSPLFQLRLRVQLVPSSQRGGWVVEQGWTKYEPTNSHSTDGDLLNLHCGLKVQSIYVFASPLAFKGIVDNATDIVNSLTFSSERKAFTKPPISVDEVAGVADIPEYHALKEESSKACANDTLTPCRWRVDVAVERVSVVFPCRASIEWTPQDHVGNYVVFKCSMYLSVEESHQSRNALAITFGIEEAAVTRSSDDWPILERMAVSCNARIKFRGLHRVAMPPPQLKRPTDSVWNKVEAVMLNENADMEDSLWASSNSDDDIALSLSIAPIHLNISAPVYRLLDDTAKTMTERKPQQDTVADSVSPKPNNNAEAGATRRAGLRCRLQSLEFRLLHEADNGSTISDADPMLSMIVSDVALSGRYDSHRLEANLKIEKVSLYDLSSLPGVRVLGREYGTDEGSKASAPIVTMAMRMIDADDNGVSIDLDVLLGRLQFIVVPSVLGSLLEFQSRVQDQVDDRDRAVPERNHTSMATAEEDLLDRRQLPLDIRNVLLSFRSVGFECIISSRDIYSHIEEGSMDPITVVAFRWKTEIKGAFSLERDTQGFLRALAATGSPSLADAQFVEAPRILQDFIGTQLKRDVAVGDDTKMEKSHSEEREGYLRFFVNAKMVLTIEGFQALRTSVTRLVRKTDGDCTISTVPYCYMVNPPAIGEQRITNEIKFKLSHSLAGISLQADSPEINASDTEGIPCTRTASSRLKFAHALQLEVGFVDVILYLRQSTHGMHEAFRVTLKPMLSMVKGSEGSERQRNIHISGQSSSASQSSLKDMIKSATSVASVQAKGFQVTCVPGATRLTESPIIKCAFMEFSLGFAAIGAPKDTEKSPYMVQGVGSDANSKNDALNTVVADQISHIVAGGWFQCELSASYHNRRLAAWEPAVEPWDVDARIGVDLVQLLNIEPLKCREEVSRWTKLSTPPSLKGFLPDVINERAGERIRDIGRLLRSPFKADLPSPQFAEDSLQSTIETQSDLCFLMLASMERTMTELAFYPALRNTHHLISKNALSHQRKLSFLPGRSVMEWLVQFGYPLPHDRDLRNFCNHPPLSISISDSRPLNVNLTSAFIDNMLRYMSLHVQEGPKSRPVGPHWIRNDSGMKIRFREVLDRERLDRGEKARRITLSTGSEIPLSLKRAISQSCDPHQSHIWLEVGGFEDTAGRVHDQEYDIPKGSLSTSFRYKVLGKIPVDTVGVHQLPLTLNNKIHHENATSDSKYSRNFGLVIVRIALRGGIKVVSVESPLVLKNTVDSDLVVEVRDHGVGQPLIWRALIPKSPMTSAGEGAIKSDSSYVAVPIDIIPSLDDKSAVLSVSALPRDSKFNHETEISDVAQVHSVRVTTPPPYSKQSIRRGVVNVSELSLEPVPASARTAAFLQLPPRVHLNACAVRIGRFALDQTPRTQDSNGTRGVSGVPEQRMLLFRPPFVIKNHLPVSILVQVRVKATGIGRRRPSSSRLVALSRTTDESVENEWVSLGLLPCGKAISWTGAVVTSKVELRVRICEKSGQQSREFPSWSTSVVAPTPSSKEAGSGYGVSDSSTGLKLLVDDTFGVPLGLSVDLEENVHVGDSDSAPQDNIRGFASSLPEASRVLGIYVPFWIVDSTGRDLEFFANTVVAGQMSHELPHPHHSTFVGDDRGGSVLQPSSALGLAELMDDEKQLSVRSRPPFDVLMIGDEKSNRLSIRRRRTRVVEGNEGTEIHTPWSDPIALQAAENFHQDVAVSPPTTSSVSSSGKRSFLPEPFAFRSRIVSAPERFGGRHGTRLIHLVNRYAVLNELGREVEMLADHRYAAPVSIGVHQWPTPFHFDDSHRIRIRPKEFGWSWSGPFSLTKNRREVMIRMRHKLKGHVLIVSIEFYRGQNSPSNLLVLRTASHPPFRIENHTMHPLHFGQSSTFVADDYSLDTMLLPYHNADFAWDEPDERWRAVVVCVADFVYSVDAVHPHDGRTLGSFKLDQIAPGTDIKLRSPLFAGQVVADGPTQVLRITDASLPRLPTSDFDSVDENKRFHQPDFSAQASLCFELKLSHGVGISIVDSSPLELLYMRLDDITMERRVASGKENNVITLGCVTVNNQLWVTPYPVLMKIGNSSRERNVGLVEKRRKRKNKHNAVVLSWCRAINSHGGHGDLTLLNNVELSTEPITLSIDGALSDLIWAMALQIAGFSLDASENPDLTSRNTELRTVLGIVDYRDGLSRPGSSSTTGAAAGNGQDMHSLGSEFLATAAMAAKLQARPTSAEMNLSLNMGSQEVGSSSWKNISEEALALQSPARRKFYIEKLKISTVKTDISWSGALPAPLFSLFGWVRPALTVEDLPLLLRQYTTSHAYGTLEDHLQNMKYHYVSIWRILDVLVGLTFRPTVLVRACIITSREGIATAADWISRVLLHARDTLLRLGQESVAPQSLSSESLLTEKQVLVNRVFHQAFFVIPTKLISSVLSGSAGFASVVSSSFRYGGGGVSGHPRSTNGSIRSRNPRLFAHIGGKDLLVEYVEGENAGNALLSRVRMGMHLGEGYICHMEGVGLDARKSEAISLILMLTSERVLLLNGNRFDRFCSVLWEVSLDNVVYFEVCSTEDDSSRDLVKFWYLIDSSNKRDDNLSRYAAALVRESNRGLDLLQCESFLVPSGNGAFLREKINAVHHNVLQ